MSEMALPMGILPFWVKKGGPSGPPPVPVLTSIWNLITAIHFNINHEKIQVKIQKIDLNIVVSKVWHIYSMNSMEKICKNRKIL